VRRLRILLCGLTLAALFATAGSWLGWRFHGGLPSDAEMRSIVAVLGAEGELWRDEAVSVWSAPPVTPVSWLYDNEDGLTAGQVNFQAATEVSDLQPLFTHLRETGWRVGAEQTAAKGEWRLNVPSNDGRPTIRIERAAPLLSIVLALLSGLVGAVLGWWLTRRREFSLPVALIVIAGILALLPNTIFAPVGLIGNLLALDGTHGFPIMWTGILMFGFLSFPLVGLALLIGVFLTGWQGRPAPTISAPSDRT
jgi:hypothetical protein